MDWAGEMCPGREISLGGRWVAGRGWVLEEIGWACVRERNAMGCRWPGEAEKLGKDMDWGGRWVGREKWVGEGEVFGEGDGLEMEMG